MTPLAKRQLLDALHPHYLKASRSEKTTILDAFVKATGYHRKYGLGLLRHGPPPKCRHRRPKERYGPLIVDALRSLWDVSGHLCSKRLHPFLGSLLDALDRCGEVRLPPPIKAELLLMSPATIDRKLAPYRRRLQPKGVPTTRPGALLKHHIPIRLYTPWDDRRPGFTEMDLVAHCGDSSHGEFVHTLALVDIATGWFEPDAVASRSQKRVFEAFTAIRERLPFPLLGIDSDNDNAFINDHLLRYCHAEQITFTRSRDYRKNDQAHIEERNGSVIRRTVGYDRYEGEPAAEAFTRVYAMLRLWINYFQPTMKLVAKTRVGAKVIKRYDRATTPYQRVLDSPHVSNAHKQALRDIYQTLNPRWIRAELDRRLQTLWSLASRSGLGMRQWVVESQVLR